MIPLLFRILLLAICCLASVAGAREVALVTGASRGIGAAIADLLAKEGYAVYAGARSVPSTEERENIHWVQLDVTDQESVDRAVQTVIDNEGRVDVLVNNAGIMFYGSVENVAIEEAERIFDVNFFGVIRMTQAVLPHMRDKKKGRIIQISSRSGFRPLPSLSVYAASKFALEGLSETAAALLKPWNISVSVIEPGPVATELDFTSPYGSGLPIEEDPYREIFEGSGLLDPNSPIVQSAEEIASIVQKAIEAEKPLFRYQTTENIQKQAGRRLVDITGNSSVDEWDAILFPR